MKFIRAINASDPSALEQEWIGKLYDGKLPTNSIIKADLEYISTQWNRTGFDLWEEVDDMHFYTLIVQRRALVEGSNLATLLGDHYASKWYDSQQIMLKEFLEQKFWNEKRGHLMSMLNTPDRGGIDCSLVLGALHGGSDDLYPSWSDEVLASMEKLITEMAILHPINRLTPPYHPEGRLRGVGIGRYPEDRFV